MSEITEINEYKNELGNTRVLNTITSDTERSGKVHNLIINDSMNSSEINNPLGISEDDPLTEENIHNIEKLMKQIKNSLEIIEDIWYQTKNKWQITNKQMMELHKYNISHAEAPEDSDNMNYDQYNGVDNISPDDIKLIFGLNHPITKIASIEEKREVVKECMQDCFNYINMMQEYNQTDIMYRNLLELKEDQEFIKLIAIADNESDPDKKAKLMDSINQYHSTKYMDYLKDTLSDKDKNALIDTFGDPKKIDYWIKRSITKLEQMNINKRFILSISGLEKNQLPERYHLLSNMTLLYFMRSIIFNDTAANNFNKTDKSKIIAMIHALDGVVRNSTTTEHKTRILNNIMAFLDQLIEPIYERYYPDKIIIDMPTSNKKEE